MTTIRQDAKQVAEAITVLQCKEHCPQLTSIAGCLNEIFRYGFRNPSRSDPAQIALLLAYNNKSDDELIYAPETQIKAFAHKYQNELEAVLRQIGTGTTMAFGR